MKKGLGKVNELRVIITGISARCLVNDIQLGTVDLKDPPGPRQIGLAAGSGDQVYTLNFSDLRVRQPQLRRANEGALLYADDFATLDPGWGEADDSRSVSDNKLWIKLQANVAPRILYEGRTFENARSAAVNPVFATTNTYTVNANVSQTLFQGGRLIATARAAIARESATVTNARRELDRRAVLLRQELIAQSEKDQAQTSYDTAVAQVEAARSQERAGQAAQRFDQLFERRRRFHHHTPGPSPQSGEGAFWRKGFMSATTRRRWGPSGRARRCSPAHSRP